MLDFGRFLREIAIFAKLMFHSKNIAEPAVKRFAVFSNLASMCILNLF